MLRLVATNSQGISLIGRTAIHESLIASNEKLLAEAKAAALGIGDDAAWIERVIVSTEPELDLHLAPENHTR
jgi:exonuclease SbcD